MYESIGVGRDNKAGRFAQFAKNLDFFGAPAAPFLFHRSCEGPPQWSDLGMFLQTFMLLAQEAGIDTCSQEAWAVHEPASDGVRRSARRVAAVLRDGDRAC